MSSSQAIVNWLNALDQSDFSLWVWCIIIKDISVKLISANLWASLQSCCTKIIKNLLNRFQINKSDYKAPLIVITVDMATAPLTAKLLKKLKFVLTSLLPFLRTKGLRVSEKRWMKHRHQKLCSATLDRAEKRLRMCHFRPSRHDSWRENIDLSNTFRMKLLTSR